MFLAGWPAANARLADDTLVEEIAETRRVVELGRSARSTAGIKLRQPLPVLVVEGAGEGAGRHTAEIAGELRVKEVRFGPIEGATLRAKPNLPLLGPKLGKELPAVREALAAGAFDPLPGGGVRVRGHELKAEEVFVERAAPEGFALAEDGGLLVALDTRLDDELVLEGRALDVIHELQALRKDAGLVLTDRIVVRHDGSEWLDEVFGAHGEWIARETLATRIERVPGARLAVEQVT